MSDPYVISGVIADVVFAAGVEAPDVEAAGDCAAVTEVLVAAGAWAAASEMPSEAGT